MVVFEWFDEWIFCVLDGWMIGWLVRFFGTVIG